MTKSDDTNPQKMRDPAISWRPPAHLREAFNEMVGDSGMNRNAFLTHCVYSKRRSSYPPDVKSVSGRLLRYEGELASLFRRLLPLIDALQDQNDPSLILEKIHALLVENAEHQLEIRSALFLVLGRKP